MNFLDKYSKLSLPTQIIIAGGGTLFVIWGYNQIKKSLGGFKDRLNIQQDILQYQFSGQKPSYQDSQYKILADKLRQSMDSTWYDPTSYGTDEEQIRGVFSKMNNNLDVLKLVQSFGNPDGYSLSDWLTSELSQLDIQIYVNAPLKAKGITYTF